MNDSEDKSDLARIPEHLRPMLQPTPSGIAKLVAAWDGLSIETQILLLTKIRANEYTDSWLSLGIKALESPNAYVRYLGARKISSSCTGSEPDEKAKALRIKIESDSNPLVKYCLLENTPSWRWPEGGLEAFWKLPHDARLASVRGLLGEGEKFASVIQRAIDNEIPEGRVSESELLEVLMDYMLKSQFMEHYSHDWSAVHTERPSWSDGLGAYQNEGDLEALWGLVPKLPERPANFLIQYLPHINSLLDSSRGDIPQEVIDNLKDDQLKRVLERPDIELKDFRKRIVFESKETGSFLSSLRYFACLYNFDFTNDEFAQILSRPREERVSVLKDILEARDLSLVYYNAIYDVLSRDDESILENASSLRILLGQRANQIHGIDRKYQIKELRMYRLAANIVPWNQNKGIDLPAELQFLSNSIVPGDTWATFSAFYAKWLNPNWDEAKLPRIYELEEEASSNIGEEE